MLTLYWNNNNIFIWFSIWMEHTLEFVTDSCSNFFSSPIDQRHKVNPIGLLENGTGRWRDDIMPLFLCFVYFDVCVCVFVHNALLPFVIYDFCEIVIELLLSVSLQLHQFKCLSSHLFILCDFVIYFFDIKTRTHAQKRGFGFIFFPLRICWINRVLSIKKHTL